MLISSNRTEIQQKQSRVSLVRAATSIALHPKPIRTCRSALRVDGVGNSWLELLRANSHKPDKKGTTKWRHEPPPQGKYSSPAVAVLVVLLEAMETSEEDPEHSACIPWDTLLSQATESFEDGRSFLPVEALKAGNEFCSAWEQVRVLLHSKDDTKVYIKQRSRKKGEGGGAVFELTECGRVLATRLRAEAAAPTEVSDCMLSSGSHALGPVRLLVDFREHGGERFALNDFCDHLDRHAQVPYGVRHLGVGDFMFQLIGQSCSGTDNASRQLNQAAMLESNNRTAVLPWVVERKEAKDLALSMMDGRWGSQKAKMLEAKANFLGSKQSGAGSNLSAQEVRLFFVLEGHLKSARARCCEKGCLASCGGPTLEQVEAEVAQLEVDGFEVVKTGGLAQTAAVVAAKVKLLAEPFQSAFKPTYDRAAALLFHSNQPVASLSSSLSSSSSSSSASASSSSSSSSTAVSQPPPPESTLESRVGAKRPANANSSKPPAKRPCSASKTSPMAPSASDVFVLVDSSDDENIVEQSASASVNHAVELPHPWVCEYCTVENEPGRTRCNACELEPSSYEEREGDAIENSGDGGIGGSSGGGGNDHGGGVSCSDDEDVLDLSASIPMEATYDSDDSDDMLLKKVVIGSSSASSSSSSSAATASTNASNAGAAPETPLDATTALLKLSASELKQRCKAEGFAVSGTKPMLVQRLQGPPLPSILKERKVAGEYVPRIDSANSALLVALHLYETSGAAGEGPEDGEGERRESHVRHSGSSTSRASLPMLSKADLMHRAEATGISRDSIETPRGNGGTYEYDGWASVRAKLTDPDPTAGYGPPLMKRFGRDSYKLTTLPLGNAGRDVAKALHDYCHTLELCHCGRDPSATIGLRDLQGSSFLEPAASAAPAITVPPAATTAATPHLTSPPSTSTSTTSSSAPNPVYSASQPAEGPAEPSAVAKTARKCSKCGAIGHNARNPTCPKFVSQDEAPGAAVPMEMTGDRSNDTSSGTATIAAAASMTATTSAGGTSSEITGKPLGGEAMSSGQIIECIIDSDSDDDTSATGATPMVASAHVVITQSDSQLLEDMAHQPAGAHSPPDDDARTNAACIIGDSQEAEAADAKAARVAYLEAKRREIDLEREAASKEAAGRTACVSAAHTTHPPSPPPPSVQDSTPSEPIVHHSRESELRGTERAALPEVIEID